MTKNIRTTSKSKSNIDLKDRIFIFDLNHTLINTGLGHYRAMQNMLEALLAINVLEEKARAIVKRVHYTTSLMIAGFLITADDGWNYVPGGKDAYKELLSQISKHQKHVYRDWNFIKKWSREVFLKISADAEGIDLDNESIRKIVDAHWEGITHEAKPFESAKKLFSVLHEKNIPAYLLTSSDGRLIYKNGSFMYEPDFSKTQKRNRLKILEKEGISFKKIIIGDPYDKPSVKFFSKGVKEIMDDYGGSISTEKFVMIGNSFEDDLETPMNVLNFGMGILVDEGARSEQISKNILRVNSLEEIIDLLE